jgi:hypothetical protein
MIALGLWGLFLIAAVLYTQREKHPDAKPVAAYMIFVIVFTVTAFVLFAAITFILDAAGYIDALESPVVAVIFLILVFGPAFLLGRWQLKKPPRPPRQP